tara:strand:+ start:302 stop:610 length:309 start_codon:yes stop_codon:yes gene_type:complete
MYLVFILCSRVLSIFMILGTAKLHSRYKRKRNGKYHVVSTTQTVYHLQCDNCNIEFSRTAKELNKRSQHHVCSNCDQKRFAQKQSSIWKRVGKFDASSGLRL